MPRKPLPPIILTSDQEDYLKNNFKKIPDLNILTQRVFKNNQIDGRSREGRAVKKFLKEINADFNTIKFRPSNLRLTPEQKEFLMGPNIGADMKAIEIARITFKDKDVKSLSKEHSLVLEFLNEFRPEIMNENNLVTNEKYNPPHALSRSIKKVNDYLHKSFEEEHMPTRYKKYCEKLLDYLHSPRFISIINSYSLVSDRELFEAEYVRTTWDKPDLTIDELNNYITVCSNYVRLKHIQKRVDNLNKLLNLEHDDAQISIKLNELLKATSSELNDCEKRIEAMTKSLNGTRADRMKHHHKDNGSILALVEAFQLEEERKKLLELVEMENKLVENEYDKLEDLEEYKVRVLGMSKGEIL